MKGKYKQTKIKTIWARMRYFIALLKCKLLFKNNPVIAVIIVNSKCNFSCRYCFGNYYDRKVKDYTTDELKYLIDELYNLGIRYLNIHGGETLLRQDIGEIVDYIKQKGMYCCLITNGTLLEKKLDKIRNIDNLTISLDGRKENNDKNRGEGTHDIALNAIKLAIKEKLPLRVSATFTKYTMNDVDYMANLARDLGFALQFSILFKPLPEFKDMEMSNEEIKQAIDKVIEYKKKGYPIFTSYVSARYARDWPFDHNQMHYITKEEEGKLPKGFKKIKCYYGKLKFNIEADGNVYPCFLLGDPALFKPLNWKEVGVKTAIEHVIKNRECTTCPTMTHNDHNLLMDLNFKHILTTIFSQIKETFSKS